MNGMGATIYNEDLSRHLDFNQSPLIITHIRPPRKKYFAKRIKEFRSKLLKRLLLHKRIERIGLKGPP
jgi:hypothetical protein